MAAVLLSPRRIRKNRLRWRRYASARTVYAYVGGNPISFVDPLGLDFFGKCLAMEYLEKHGDAAWERAVADRMANVGDVYPGTAEEELRNAEHYLYARRVVSENGYEWGGMLVNTFGYHVVKFWGNVADHYGILNSPFKQSWPTQNELRSGIEGANDGLFGGGDNAKCDCQ